MALLVDDKEYVRQSTAEMLVDLGYDIIEATPAEEALRIIESDVRVFVTDHLMFGMSGTCLATEIRDRRPTMPVLLISDYAEVYGIAPDRPD